LKKGKSKKLALVAVGHKLLRQCFGVLRSGKEFNPSLVKSTWQKNTEHSEERFLSCHSKRSKAEWGIHSLEPRV